MVAAGRTEADCARRVSKQLEVSKITASAARVDVFQEGAFPAYSLFASFLTLSAAMVIDRGKG
jgi:hypothetical protein